MTGLFQRLLAFARHRASPAAIPPTNAESSTNGGGEFRGAYQVLEGTVNADLTRLLTERLDERLAGIQARYLETFRAIVATAGENPELLLPVLTGDVKNLVTALVPWPEQLSQEMHTTFAKDGKSVLELFQSTAANNSNYQFLIESKAIAAAQATFADAMAVIESQYPAIDVTALGEMERLWFVEWIVLKPRSHRWLETEATKAKRTGEVQPLIDLIDIPIRDSVGTCVDLFRRTHLRALKRSLRDVAGEERLRSIDWPSWVDREQIAESFQRDFSDAEWPRVKPVAAQWVYIQLTIESERVNVAEKILTHARDQYGDWIRECELEDRIESIVQARVNEGFAELETEAHALARARIEAVLAGL